MDCKEFKDYLPDLMENEAGLGIKEDMMDHIKKCEECRAIYDSMKFSRKDFTDFFKEKGREYESQKDIILSKIDKNLYTKNNKMSFWFKKHKKALYPLVAAVFLGFIFIFSYRYVYENIMFGATKCTKEASAGNKAKDEKTKDHQPLIEYKEDISTSDSEKSISEKEIILEKMNVSRKKSIEKTLKLLREEIDIGVYPWKIIYSDEHKVIFNSYSHILAYSFDERIGVYSAIDLKKLGFNGNIQGSEMMYFDPSPDGHYILASTITADAEGDIKNPVYVIDVVNNSVKKILDGNRADLIVDWSSNSRYLGIGICKGSPEGYIYDAAKNKITEVKGFSGKQCFGLRVSDSGYAVMDCDSKRYFYRDNYKKPEYVSDKGITRFSGDRWIVTLGNEVYEVDKNSEKPITRFKSGLNSIVKDDKVYAYDEKDKSKMAIFNFNTLESFEYKDSFDKSIEPHFISNKRGNILSYSLLGPEDNIKVLFSDNRPSKIVKPSMKHVSYNFKDENTLIYIALKDGAQKNGEFRIVAYDLNEDKEKVLFDNK